MCAILDANQAADFANGLSAIHIEQLARWMVDGGKIAVGGYLSVELARVSKIRGLLTEWERRGQLVKVADDIISGDQEAIASQIRSDDPHVVALLRNSTADVLVTNDHALISDAKDRNLIGRKIKIIRPTFENRQAAKRVRTILESSDC